VERDSRREETGSRWEERAPAEGSLVPVERKVTETGRKSIPLESERTIDERRLTIDEGWGSRQPP
jgi:hypothetical protein